MEFDFSASKLNNIYTTLEQDNNSFLVYTTCAQTVCKLICTDTKTFWYKNVDMIGIRGDVKTAKLESEEKYIAYLRDNLLVSDFRIETKNDKEEVLSLLIGNSPVLRLEFQKWLDVNGDEELCSVLFRMAKHTSKITKELERAEQGDERRSRAEHQSGRLIHDFNVRLQKGNAASKIRRKPGMSVINPNSKKLKQDKGIVFN